jgi:hypothetical protein
MNSADSICALMAAAIIFIVYVQRKAVLTSYQTLIFEGVKSTLATALWLWLILDAAFGPWSHQVDQVRVDRQVERAAFSVLLLL